MANGRSQRPPGTVRRPAGPGVPVFPRLLPILVSVFPSLALLGLPVIVVRPNRIAAGETYGLATDLIGAVGFVAAAALCGVALLLITVVSVGHRRAGGGITSVGTQGANVLWAVIATLVPWFLFYRGAVSVAADETVNELARITPGAGVWLAFVGALAAWHEAVREISGSARKIVLVALAGTGVVVGLILASPPLGRLSYFVEYAVREDRFAAEFVRHIGLSGGAVSLATLVGVPAGMVAYRKRAIRDLILDITSTIQTIPSLAMFGLLIAPLAALSRAVPALRAIGVSGVGVTPAVIALFLYALLPVVRNTLTGLAVVPPEVRESGRAMGMTRGRLFWMVEVPLALPVVLRGMRTAAVQAVGNTTVAGLIGAGGLGWFIFQGLGQAATDLVVLGVIPIVVLAVVVDRVFLVLQRLTDRAGSMAGAEGAGG